MAGRRAPHRPPAAAKRRLNSLPPAPPETAPHSAPCLIARNPLKPCDGAVFTPLLFAPLFEPNHDRFQPHPRPHPRSPGRPLQPFVPRHLPAGCRQPRPARAKRAAKPYRAATARPRTPLLPARLCRHLAGPEGRAATPARVLRLPRAGPQNPHRLWRGLQRRQIQPDQRPDRRKKAAARASRSHHLAAHLPDARTGPRHSRPQPIPPPHRAFARRIRQPHPRRASPLRQQRRPPAGSHLPHAPLVCLAKPGLHRHPRLLQARRRARQPQRRPIGPRLAGQRPRHRLGRLRRSRLHQRRRPGLSCHAQSRYSARCRRHQGRQKNRKRRGRYRGTHQRNDGQTQFTRA